MIQKNGPQRGRFFVSRSRRPPVGNAQPTGPSSPNFRIDKQG
nr:MAG TPA: hypothetical protein [Caudoviricetes sp.]